MNDGKTRPYPGEWGVLLEAIAAQPESTPIRHETISAEMERVKYGALLRAGVSEARARELCALPLDELVEVTRRRPPRRPARRRTRVVH